MDCFFGPWERYAGNGVDPDGDVAITLERCDRSHEGPHDVKRRRDDGNIAAIASAAGNRLCVFGKHFRLETSIDVPADIELHDWKRVLQAESFEESDRMVVPLVAEAEAAFAYSERFRFRGFCEFDSP